MWELFWEGLGAFLTGRELGSDAMGYCDEYESGNAVSDAAMDWMCNEYEDDFGSYIGDFWDSGGDIG